MANFCKVNTDRAASSCDVNYAQALATALCASSQDAASVYVYNAACSAHFFLLDYCANLGPGCTRDNTSLCTAQPSACAFHPALGSSALLAYAASLGTWLGSEIQAALVTCGAARNASACAAALPPVTVNATTLAKYQRLTLDTVPSYPDNAVIEPLGDSTRILGYIVQDNGTVSLATPLLLAGMPAATSRAARRANRSATTPAGAPGSTADGDSGLHKATFGDVSISTVPTGSGPTAQSSRPESSNAAGLVIPSTRAYCLAVVALAAALLLLQ